jgi:hypothetical protein
MATRIVSQYVPFGMRDVCSRMERTPGVGAVHRFGPAIASAPLGRRARHQVGAPAELRALRVSSGTDPVTEVVLVYDGSVTEYEVARRMLADVVAQLEVATPALVRRAS